MKMHEWRELFIIFHCRSAQIQRTLDKRLGPIQTAVLHPNQVNNFNLDLIL